MGLNSVPKLFLHPDTDKQLPLDIFSASFPLSGTTVTEERVHLDLDLGSMATRVKLITELGQVEKK